MSQIKFSKGLPTIKGWYWRKYKQNFDILWLEYPEKLICNEKLNDALYKEALNKYGKESADQFLKNGFDVEWAGPLLPPIE